MLVSLDAFVEDILRAEGGWTKTARLDNRNGSMLAKSVDAT